MTGIPYDAAAIDAVACTLDLRAPNRRALEALAIALAEAPTGAELVADLATGVGKTYVAGALLDYLYLAGVRDVVVITPGSTIQRKTIDNLTPGHRRYLRGLASRPLVVTLDDVETATVGQALQRDDVFKVFVLTVQSLLRPDTVANRRAHRPHEMIGRSLSEYLRGVDDLVVIADEHHVYFSGNAAKFKAAIIQLDPAAVVGLTATVHESTAGEQIVYRYGLAEAIADGYVKIPVLVARPDAVTDQRTQLTDGVALLQAKAAAMRAYCERTGSAYLEPVMFVVCSTIDEAHRIADVLAGPDLLDGAERVLVVTSQEPDETLRLLDGIEEPDSPVRAVVSVSMLKEGWDVKNIYVIASVRALESQLLTEQILGRGLRLPFGRRTGVGLLDTVEVLSHQAFDTLLEQAQALLAHTLGQRAGQARLERTDAGDLVATLPGHAAADADPRAGTKPDTGASHQVGGLATVQARLAAGETTTHTLRTPLPPRPAGGLRLPLAVPQVTTRWVRETVSLTALDPDDVQALGARFAAGHAPSLTRTGLGALRVDGEVQVSIGDRGEQEQLGRASPPVPFEAAEADLVTRLLRSDDVVATAREAEAAGQVARRFLIGVRSADAVHAQPARWTLDHARAATEALIARVRAEQASAVVREVVEVTTVSWPAGPPLLLTAAPTDRRLLTDPAAFVPRQPYSGWRTALYDAVWFDAYATGLRLAELLDGCDDVTAWVPVTVGVPVRIPYRLEGVPHLDRPDFLVVDSAGVHWLVQADRDTVAPAATRARSGAREAGARAWIVAANARPDADARWGHLWCGEAAIVAATGWTDLKAAGRVHGG